MRIHEQAKHFEKEALAWRAFALAMLQGSILWSPWESRAAFSKQSPAYEVRFAIIGSGRVYQECRYVSSTQAGGNYTTGTDGRYHSVRMVTERHEQREIVEKYFTPVDNAVASNDVSQAGAADDLL